MLMDRSDATHTSIMRILLLHYSRQTRSGRRVVRISVNCLLREIVTPSPFFQPTPSGSRCYCDDVTTLLRDHGNDSKPEGEIGPLLPQPKSQTAFLYVCKLYLRLVDCYDHILHVGFKILPVKDKNANLFFLLEAIYIFNL